VRVVGVKSHRSERPIALVDDEVALLRQQRRAQAAKRLAAEDWQDDGLVLRSRTDRDGRSISTVCAGRLNSFWRRRACRS
jgi:hypothetical protein